MDSCCDPRGHERLFDARNAEADAERYRRSGLDPLGRRMVDALAARGLAGSTVLEIGGGVGALHLELLRAGAERATNVEIVASYEASARELLAEMRLADKVERHVLDFARDGDRIPEADVVVLHRVICCYPDMPALLGRSAAHARGYLALTYPPSTWWRRLTFAAENLLHRIRRRGFTAYVHDPVAMREEARRAGFRMLEDSGGAMWRLTVFERVRH